MASCESAIRAFLSGIEPTQAQKSGAQRSHNYLRGKLCTGQFTERIKTSYLSGSYARDTAIAPLDDVDIVFVVNPEAWKLEWLSSRPSPETVLASFAKAVRYRYPESSVRLQRRSICLQLYHLDIDVVPAIEADTSGQMIWVPDRVADTWIKSSPKRHAEFATEINRIRNGNFKPLVKLLKLWNSNLPNTANLKSFTVETMALRLFAQVDIPSLEDGLMRYFDFVAHLHGQAKVYRWPATYGMSFTRWSADVQDMAGTGSNLIANVDASRRDKFVKYAIQSRERMIEAGKAVRVDTACRKVAQALRW